MNPLLAHYCIDVNHPEVSGAEKFPSSPLSALRFVPTPRPLAPEALEP